LRGALGAEPYRLGTELLRQAEVLGDALAIPLAHAERGRRLDEERDPLRTKAGGHAPRRAHESGRRRARAHAHENALRHRPRVLAPFGATLQPHLLVDASGRLPKGELAERRERPLLEKALHRLPRLLGDVDLAVGEAIEELVGRQVDEANLVGLLDDAVGDRLT